MRSFRGNLAQVIAANHLGGYHSWPSVNTPPGEDLSVEYFLNEGDLFVYYSGEPAVVRHVEFWPRDSSAAARFGAANEAWVDMWTRMAAQLVRSNHIRIYCCGLGGHNGFYLGAGKAWIGERIRDHWSGRNC